MPALGIGYCCMNSCIEPSMSETEFISISPLILVSPCRDYFAEIKFKKFGAESRRPHKP